MRGLNFANFATFLKSKFLRGFNFATFLKSKFLRDLISFKVYNNRKKAQEIRISKSQKWLKLAKIENIKKNRLQIRIQHSKITTLWSLRHVCPKNVHLETKSNEIFLGGRDHIWKIFWWGTRPTLAFCRASDSLTVIQPSEQTCLIWSLEYFPRAWS